ncbi:MAG: M67 family metallopeptidase [Lacrimispora sp.]|uniref:M67 family metallopeptidase n=1 Tax=Lacrimispora sp. TaxID=2719234 RepID=UPI0039E46758
MLILKKEDFDRILKHCREGLPNEACGLIAGRIDGETKTVEKVYLLTNVDESRDHFSMDPKEQFAAVKDARKEGLELLGNFHSHPESPSRPSEEDKRLAYDSASEYLILSLMDEEHPVLNAFHIDKDKNVSKNEIRMIE